MKGNLKKHIKSKLEGLTFKCQYCEFNAKYQLKIHTDSLHEGKT